MSEAIIAAIISGLVTLAGVLLSNGKTTTELRVRLDELARELHDELAPLIHEIPVLKEKAKRTDVRLNDLEKASRQRQKGA